MNLFQNKYRTKSARLQTWDYRWAGAYFITICTQKRSYYFGEIKNGQMQLSPIGLIADILWHEIKNHFKNVELGEFVLMPNHIHGVIIITNDNINDNDNVSGQSNRSKTKTIGQQRFQNIGKNSISSIVGSYKSAVTKHAHRLNFDFAWQTRFHDHIIRDDKSFQHINNYIINNPANWQGDKFFSE